MATQENYIEGIYKCLTCSKIVGHSIYFCKEHFDQHYKEYKEIEEHISIKYDKKYYYYYCDKHLNEFTKYCFTHNQNIRKECEKEHENDKIADHQDMTPDINKLKESLDTM